jgi:hypothetical protein
MRVCFGVIFPFTSGTHFRWFHFDAREALQCKNRPLHTGEQICISIERLFQGILDRRSDTYTFHR